jgi:N-acetylmuramoyl-L-alanine amidase
MPAELRQGSHGESVRDLQTRLASAGYLFGPDDPGEFGDGTVEAVRAFQDARGLRVDGLVGRQTWSTLVESGFALGDRLLYFRRPMLRGDDVTDAQRRLNALGFDAGREDGILGDETHAALIEFQRAMGLVVDGICGSTTIAALDRVGSLATDGSVRSVREREELRTGPRVLAGRKVYVAAAPELVALAEHVRRGLVDAGAHALLDATGEDDALVDLEANRFEADLFLALRPGDSTCRCAYFAAGRFRSEAGYAVAVAINDALTPILSSRGDVCGKAYAALRETHMAAVVVEIVAEGDVDAMRTVVTNAGAVGRAIVHGVHEAIEHPTVDG